VQDRYDDAIALFNQDVPPELAAQALNRARIQSEARMGEPSPLRARPDTPTRVLICRDDRLFPLHFLRRVARERLGITPDEIDGGHTPALSRPHELAQTASRRTPPNKDCPVTTSRHRRIPSQTGSGVLPVSVEPTGP
jgi:pimeloyl-ACP methyl ester carboxylesterase